MTLVSLALCILWKRNSSRYYVFYVITINSECGQHVTIKFSWSLYLFVQVFYDISLKRTVVWKSVMFYKHLCQCACIRILWISGTWRYWTFINRNQNWYMNSIYSNVHVYVKKYNLLIDKFKKRFLTQSTSLENLSLINSIVKFYLLLPERLLFTCEIFVLLCYFWYALLFIMVVQIKITCFPSNVVSSSTLK